MVRRCPESCESRQWLGAGHAACGGTYGHMDMGARGAMGKGMGAARLQRRGQAPMGGPRGKARGRGAAQRA